MTSEENRGGGQPWLELLAVEEHERRKLSFELQQKIVLHLSMLSAMIVTLAETPFPDHYRLRQEVRRIGEHLDGCMESLLEIIRSLDCLQLEGGSLPNAVAALCREKESCLGIPVGLRLSGMHRLSPTTDRTLSMTIFRIVQEALLNIEQHAGATSVEVRLVAAGSSVILSIADNGRGFGPKCLADGEGEKRCFGLVSMRTRALSLGGTFKIDVSGSRGTRIGVEFPWREQTGQFAGLPEVPLRPETKVQSDKPRDIQEKTRRRGRLVKIPS